MKNILILVALFLIISCKHGNGNNNTLNRDTLLVNKKAYFLDSISESDYESSSYKFTSKNDTLPLDSSIIRITKDFIKIKVGDKFVEFKNDTAESDNYAKYSYVNTWINVGIVHVAGGFMEASAEYLVSLKDGRKTTLWGNPKLSPDKKLIISYFYDLGAGFNDNGIQLFKIDDGVVKPVFEKEINDWGPAEIKWESDTSLLIKRAKLDNEMKEHFDYRRMVIKN